MSKMGAWVLDEMEQGRLLSDELNNSYLAEPEKESVSVSIDGGTLWVNHRDGSCVARFSKKFGMDIHTAADEQLKGESQCLRCTSGPTSKDDFDLFRDLVYLHYNVYVPSDAVKF